MIAGLTLVELSHAFSTMRGRFATSSQIRGGSTWTWRIARRSSDSRPRTQASLRRPRSTRCARLARMSTSLPSMWTAWRRTRQGCLPPASTTGSPPTPRRARCARRRTGTRRCARSSPTAIGRSTTMTSPRRSSRCSSSRPGRSSRRRSPTRGCTSRPARTGWLLRFCTRCATVCGTRRASRDRHLQQRG